MTRIGPKKGWCLALCLVLSLTMSTGAHVGDRVYPIPFLSDGMLAEIRLDDGRIDEWIELLGEPTLTLLDFADNWGQRTPNPADLDFRIWLAWHDDPARFYVGYVASDDVYKNTHDYDSQDGIQWNDGILLAIDGDHSGGAGCSSNCSEEDWLEIRGQTQYYEANCSHRQRPDLGRRRHPVQDWSVPLDSFSTLRRGRWERGRRSARHQRDRIVHHPVRPLGRNVG